MASLPQELRRAPLRDNGPAGVTARLASPIVRFRRAYLAGQERHSRLLLVVQLLYAVLFCGWLIYHHTWPAPDLIAIGLLGFAFLTFRLVSFLRDWSPFILLLLGYVGLAGVDGSVVARAHIGFPIQADRAIFFGTLPTTWLQAHLWNPAHVQWYDYMASVLYPMHFIVPLLLAFALWMWKKRFYWKFVGSYLLLCYAGFATYLLYPMAPPWWAANLKRVPAVAPVLSQVHWGGATNPIVLATKYFQPNPVAAMPSIHAAFPVLVWLVLWRIWPKWGWAAVVYPLAMTFSVIYLGEHYFIDCLAGWVYAAAAFYFVWGDHARVRGWLGSLRPQPRRGPVLVPVPVRGEVRRGG
jgi:membrane-associated phospholipid phosphatase